MLIQLWHKYSGTFVGDVALVAGGTAMAQIIGIVFLPFITRLYGPETYGTLNLFISSVAVVASIATLAYSFSIVLPKQDVVAYQLLKISFLLACAVSIMAGVLIAILKTPLIALFDLEVIASLLWLIPVAVFLTAMVQAFEQWNIRSKQYKSLSAAVIVQASFSGGSRTGVGYFAPTAMVLIILGVVAQVVQIFILYFTARHSIRHVRKFSSCSYRRQMAVFRAVARKYRDFPLYRAPQLFLNTISRATPVLLLASLFGSAAAGYYAIALSVLYLPVRLISASVGKVFLQRIATHAHSDKPVRPLIMQATSMLVLLGVVPFGIIILAGPWLFAFVFGADWGQSGNYARWLAVWVFFHFVNTPSVQSFSITNSQHLLLVWEIVTTVIKVVLLLSIGTITRNAELTVAAYAVFGALAYIVLIFIGIVQAGKYDRNSQE